MNFRSIAEIADKIKRFSRDNSDKIYHIFELCLIAAIFFGIGVLFAQTILYPQPHIKFVLDEKIAENNLAILQPSNMKDLLATVSATTSTSAPNRQAQSNKSEQTLQATGEYVASKNGKTYYKITCSNR